MDRGFSLKHVSARMLRSDATLELLMHPTQVPDGFGDRAIAIPPLSPSAQGDGAIAARCEEHQVDVVVLQRHAGRADDIRGTVSIPVHAAATRAVLDILDDKVAFALETGRSVGSAVVTNSTDLVHAVDAVRMRGYDACIKPVKGVNGMGFWRFVEDDAVRQLDEPEKREIPLSIYAAAMDASLDVSPRMVMEWLPGPEASVDLLAWHGRPLSHCVRIKTGDHTQTATSVHPVTADAHALAARYQLHGLVSIQYRLDRDGGWRVLEINPRPAGGSIYSDDAGAGLIADWTGLLTGRLQPHDIMQRVVEADILKVPGSVVTLR